MVPGVRVTRKGRICKPTILGKGLKTRSPRKSSGEGAKRSLDQKKRKSPKSFLCYVSVGLLGSGEQGNLRKCSSSALESALRHTTLTLVEPQLDA